MSCVHGLEFWALILLLVVEVLLMSLVDVSHALRGVSKYLRGSAVEPSVAHSFRGMRIKLLNLTLFSIDLLLISI